MPDVPNHASPLAYPSKRGLHGQPTHGHGPSCACLKPRTIACSAAGAHAGPVDNRHRIDYCQPAIQRRPTLTTCDLISQVLCTVHSTQASGHIQVRPVSCKSNKPTGACSSMQCRKERNALAASPACPIVMSLGSVSSRTHTSACHRTMGGRSPPAARPHHSSRGGHNNCRLPISREPYGMQRTREAPCNARAWRMARSAVATNVHMPPAARCGDKKLRSKFGCVLYRVQLGGAPVRVPVLSTDVHSIPRSSHTPHTPSKVLNTHVTLGKVLL